MYRTVRQGQRWIFATACMTYGAYYLCRVNFGQVQTELAAARGLHELDLGRILFAFTVCYILGQLGSGILCDRIGARIVAAVGAFGSAAMCVCLPLVDEPRFLIIVWGANGLFQSMGFSPCVRVLVNWIESPRRGWINGLFSISLQAGHVVSWMLAAAMAQMYDWRYAFWVPAGILSVVGVVVLLRFVDAPEDVGLSLDGHNGDEGNPEERSKPSETSAFRRARGSAVKATLRSGRVWLAGLGAGFVSVAVYGLALWLPHYLQADGTASRMASAAKAILFPLAGGTGALLAGWISDRLHGGRRMPVIVVSSLVGGFWCGRSG